MTPNLERYRKDFNKLKDMAFRLEMRMQFDLYPTEMRKQLKRHKDLDDDAKVNEFIKALPDFPNEYQKWYSESLALIRQLIPDRLADFKALYEVPKGRKVVEFGNYVMHDYLQGLTITTSWDQQVKLDGKAALPQFRIQKNIVEAAEARFESSLFDIATLAQADLLDSELDASRELLKSKFGRAAGAVAGVVLERHLGAVCTNHNLKSAKANPTISTYNDLLKQGGIIDVSQWRFIQHLGDIRNLCDHGKTADPTEAQVKDLIDGVAKTIKTIS